MKKILIAGIVLMNMFALHSAELSVLAVGYAAEMRDAAELAEKSGFSIQCIPVGGSVLDLDGTTLERKTYYWQDVAGRSADDIAEDILTALKRKPEVILLASRPAWEVYPETVRGALTGAVNDGAVLFIWDEVEKVESYFGGGLAPADFRAPCFAPVSASDDLAGAFFRFGSGLVNVRKPCCHFMNGWFSPAVTDAGEHDYYFTALTALIEWAAAKESYPIETFALADGNYTLASDRDEKLLMTVYDEHCREVASAVIGNGSGPIPELPDGRFRVVLRREDGRNMAGAWYRHTSEQGSFEAALDKNCYRAGEPFQLRLDRKGDYRITFRDNYQRILAVHAATGDAFAGIIPDNSKSVLNSVEVEKLVDGRVAGRQEIEFSMPDNRTEQDFYFFAWGSSNPSVRYADALRRLAAFGVDGISATQGRAARTIAAANMMNIPYAADFHNVKLTDLFADAWVADATRKAEEYARENLPYGAFAFTLGDENYLNIDAAERFPDDERVIRAFQAWLEARYGAIAELNRVWKRDYSGWSDIVFTAEEQLFNLEYPAAWLDYRAFAAARFIEVQHQVAAAIKKIAPDAYVGWEGGEQFSSYDGYDYADYAAAFDLTNVYARYFMAEGLPNKIFNGHCIRSFRQEHSLRGFWMNGVDYPLGIDYTVWLACMSGFNSIWWWHALFPDHECAALKPDLSAGTVFRATAEAVAQVKAGPATMLRHAIPEAPAVAVYYSALNWQVSNLSGSVGSHINNLGADTPWSVVNPALASARDRDSSFWAAGNSAGHYAVAAKSLITLCKDLNLDCRMVSPRGIVSGELNHYRVLILPFVEALADAEAAAIAQFVEAGGILIADYRTGIRDEAGNFREAGALDPVLGIKQRKPFDLQRRNQTVIVNRTMADGQASFRLPVAFVQNGVECVSAVPYGADDDGAPVFFYNSYGQGQTLYFGCDFYQYFELRRTNAENRIRDFFRESLVRHLGFPAYRAVADGYGKSLPATNVFRFRDGEVRYVGVLQDYFAGHMAPFTAVVPLFADGHIYEVTEARYCGAGERVTLSFEPGLPRLVAVYPYRIAPLEITGETRVQAGDRLTLRLQMPVTNAEAHTAQITVYDAGGREVKLYSGVVYLAGGEGTFAIPTAWDDAAGNWRVTVREAVSGLESRFDFTLAGNKK